MAAEHRHAQATVQPERWYAILAILNDGEAAAVRIMIETDDTLLAETMAATGFRTKHEVVEAGLRSLVRRKRQADARALFGRVRWEGDLHRGRLDEPDAPDQPA